MDASPNEPPYVEPLLGVVFDLDGTLVDSRHDFRRMRREVIRIAERHGVMPGRLGVDVPIHQIFEAAHTELTNGGISEGDQNRFDAEANRAIDAIELEALPRTTARKGAAGLLKALQDRGYRLGILTRSSDGFARAALRQTSLAAYFPYLRSRGTPGPAKPSPEALLLLLEEMGVPIERAVYVGDHAIDADCAVRARVRFYAILPDTPVDGGPDAERFRNLGAKAVASTVEELGRHLGVTPVPSPPAGGA